jgi:hypothetical protein
MKKNLGKEIISLSLLFIITLPLYFIADGFNKYRSLIQAGTAAYYFLICSGITFLLYLLLRIKLSKYKSSLITIWIVFVFLFFRGIINQFVFTPKMYVLNYPMYYIPFFGTATILFLIFVFRTAEKILAKHLLFLNSLFIVLLITEIIKFYVPALHREIKLIQNDKIGFRKVTLENKPSVFIILMDEYSGFNSLEKYCNYKNDDFKNALIKRGFFVALNANSNYNLTWLSCLSLFEMDYIKNQSKDELAHRSIYGKAAKAIEENNTVDFFKQNGYSIINNSFFKFRAGTNDQELLHPIENDLMTENTFITLAQHGLFNNIPSNKIQQLLNTVNAHHNNYNERTWQLLYQSIRQTDTPAFVYTHFFIPHAPYLRDKFGNRKSFKTIHQKVKHNHKAYIEYLEFANRELLKITDSIKAVVKNPVIVITSDHGNRNVKNRDRKLDYSNFIAVYKQDRNYEGFTDSTCTVNLFRILLNNTFSQNLPLLENKKIDVAKGHL